MGNGQQDSKRRRVWPLIALVVLALGPACGEASGPVAPDVEGEPDVGMAGGKEDGTTGEVQEGGDADGGGLGEDAGEDMAPACEPLRCEGACGELTNRCAERLECEPCVDEAHLERLAGWVEGYVVRMIALSYPQEVTDYDPVRLGVDIRKILREHRASDVGFVAALRYALLESRIGHAIVYETTNLLLRRHHSRNGRWLALEVRRLRRAPRQRRARLPRGARR